MTTAARGYLAVLADRSARIETEIEIERRRPVPELAIVRMLMRQRRRIAAKIARLAAED